MTKIDIREIGGDRLSMKEARERIKMSQQTLASEVGVSVAAICRYETGQRTPSVRINWMR